MDALETWDIDKEIIALSGKESTQALFIPTASSDSVDRWEIFKRVYGELLGCKTNVLYLLNRSPSQRELSERILSADLIYVGGGNTLKMMRRWRRLGVDKLLRAAYDNGIVLSGVSAGMICWFKYGHSDSMSFYHPEQWDYIRVKGMGLVDALGCPHFNSGTAGARREEDFQRMVSKHSDMGIAIDDHCAIEFVDDGYRVITSRPGVGAYRLYKRKGSLITERLDQRRELSPITQLFPGA